MGNQGSYLPHQQGDMSIIVNSSFHLKSLKKEFQKTTEVDIFLRQGKF